MAARTQVVDLSSVAALRAVARDRAAPLRDALGAALLVLVWLALWIVTWAAVAGPLGPSPRDPAPPTAASAVATV